MGLKRCIPGLLLVILSAACAAQSMDRGELLRMSPSVLKIEARRIIVERGRADAKQRLLELLGVAS